MKWCMNILIAFDYFLNAVFGGLPNETLSARALTARRDGRVWGQVLYHVLNALSPGHCERAVAGDVLRARAVEADLV
jgi:hypothetical protein